MKNKVLLFLTALLAVLLFAFCFFGKKSPKEVGGSAREDQTTRNAQARNRSVENAPSASPKDAERHKEILAPGEQKELRQKVLKAAYVLRNPSVLDPNQKLEAQKLLFEQGDTALQILISELKKENAESDTKEQIANRMALLDTLGTASASKGFVLESLKEFSRSEIDWSKDKKLQQRDLIDRLEAFEFVSKAQPEQALLMLSQLQNQKLRRKYATHFIVGQKMAGKNEEQAFQMLKKQVKDL